MFLAPWLSTPLALFPLGAFFQHSQAAPPAPPATGGGVVLPPAPSELRALPCDHAVELRWRDNSSQETGFAVLRRAPNAPGFVEIGTTGPNETSFRDENVPDGVYRYLVLARAPGQDSPSTPAVRVTFPNQPPVITCDLPATLEREWSSVHRFHVTVDDPEGDPVDLELLNPPFGVSFDPVRDATPPVTVEGRWRMSDSAENHERLLFASACTRLTVDVRRSVAAESGPRPLLGDVTGDGNPDAVVWNPGPSMSSGGRIGVYAGGSLAETPVAVLDVQGDSLLPRGSNSNWQFVQLEDVTGDGVLDVVTGSASRNVYVWAGGSGLSGAPAPTATLVPNAPPESGGNQLLGQVVQLVDVSGDGVLDVVSADSDVDIGATDVGAIFLWLGGSALTGTLAPDRTLTVPGAPARAELGRFSGVRIADLTGDGVLDFLATSQTTDPLHPARVHVWSGAAVLGGSTAPTLELASSAVPSLDFTRSPILADFTDDGFLDVIVSDYAADFGGVSSVGVLELWSLVGASGALEPTTIFSVPGAVAGDDLGIGGARLVDVSGDGLLDLVVAAPYADRFGKVDNGALYVWRGGGGSGTLAPDATLSVPGSASFDRLTSYLHFDDWDQDGVLDLLVVDVEADVEGVHDAGAVYVWNGGALSGDVAPSTTLVAATPQSDDLLGLAAYSLQVADVTGDGALDVLVSTPFADLSGVPDAGAIHVWSGATLAGVVQPVATLAGPGAETRLTEDMGFFVADLDGDGALDVLSGAGNGRLYFWRGGDGSGVLVPTARLSAAPELGHVGNGGITLADLNGDGILDVLALAPAAGFGTVDDVGALYLWRGGGLWSASVAPDATLVVGNAVAHDEVGSFPDLARIADQDGDGRLDVFSGSRVANVGGTFGASYLWSAPGSSSGLTNEAARLAP